MAGAISTLSFENLIKTPNFQKNPQLLSPDDRRKLIQAIDSMLRSSSLNPDQRGILNVKIEELTKGGTVSTFSPERLVESKLYKTSEAKLKVSEKKDLIGRLERQLQNEKLGLIFKSAFQKKLKSLQESLGQQAGAVSYRLEGKKGKTVEYTPRALPGSVGYYQPVAPLAPLAPAARVAALGVSPALAVTMITPAPAPAPSTPLTYISPRESMKAQTIEPKRKVFKTLAEKKAAEKGEFFTPVQGIVSLPIEEQLFVPGRSTARVPTSRSVVPIPAPSAEIFQALPSAPSIPAKKERKISELAEIERITAKPPVGGETFKVSKGAGAGEGPVSKERQKMIDAFKEMGLPVPPPGPLSAKNRELYASIRERPRIIAAFKAEGMPIPPRGPLSRENREIYESIIKRQKIIEAFESAKLPIPPPGPLSAKDSEIYRSILRKRSAISARLFEQSEAEAALAEREQKRMRTFALEEEREREREEEEKKEMRELSEQIGEEGKVSQRRTLGIQEQLYDDPINRYNYYDIDNDDYDDYDDEYTSYYDCGCNSVHY